MAGALHRLLSNKENELATVRCQLKELSHSHTHTLVILHERNRDVERLNSIITSLRDQAISRDMELASTQQALHASEADHELIAAKHQSQVHVLEAQVADLHAQLEREEAHRWALRVVHVFCAMMVDNSSCTAFLAHTYQTRASWALSNMAAALWFHRQLCLLIQALSYGGLVNRTRALAAAPLFHSLLFFHADVYAHGRSFKNGGRILAAASCFHAVPSLHVFLAQPAGGPSARSTAACT
ncbi:hypothetical protein DUNSADRAFT_11248 [Dunaliella salina]|uniref:Uncharacterized protein n=1 Tax=Dunaliella salina TaxID=3046 RepID=A0ABQ7GDS5_DUNSA|nr:hypothetical protein DUNSADRAFT_11248 [Dunaliella salina]|eukprot:KAF5832761.1 hypothetical protein DUNSADRAFT_11248 [Dunaliella salina]